MVKTEKGTSLWEVDDENLPKELEPIKRVFGSDPNAQRKKTETLHQYLLRKGINCWCRDCQYERKKKEIEQTTQLL